MGDGKMFGRTAMVCTLAAACMLAAGGCTKAEGQTETTQTAMEETETTQKETETKQIEVSREWKEMNENREKYSYIFDQLGISEDFVFTSLQTFEGDDGVICVAYTGAGRDGKNSGELL